MVLTGACGENLTPAEGPDASPATDCTVNRDGVMTADELPVQLGQAASVYVSDGPRAWDLNGTAVADTTRWDLSTELATDARALVQALPAADYWFAAEFPAGQFVIDDGADLLPIYHQDANGLWLHGSASRVESPANARTLVVYAQPIAVARYPLTVGDAWTSTGEIAGATIAGLPFVGSDEVRVEVVAAGRADLPYVRFSPVLLLRSVVARVESSSGNRLTRRTASFLGECVGEVAHAVSADDEPDPRFTNAVVMRRFAL